MSKVIDLAVGVAASAGDKTAVDLGGKTPFLPNRKVIVHIDAQGQTGTAPAWAIDGSDDNSTFTEIGTSVVAAGHDAIEVPCYRYMRLSVTTAAGTTAGTISAWVEGQG